MLSPAQAVIWAATFNFIAAFSALAVGTGVADTVGKGMVKPGDVTLHVVMAGLVGAIGPSAPGSCGGYLWTGFRPTVKAMAPSSIPARPTATAADVGNPLYGQFFRPGCREAALVRVSGITGFSRLLGLTLPWT